MIFVLISGLIFVSAFLQYKFRFQICHNLSKQLYSFNTIVFRLEDLNCHCSFFYFDHHMKQT